MSTENPQSSLDTPGLLDRESADIVRASERNMAELARAYLTAYLSEPFFVSLASDQAEPTSRNPTIVISSQKTMLKLPAPKTLEELHAWSPPPGFWRFILSQSCERGPFDGMFLVWGWQSEHVADSLEEAIAFITLQPGLPLKDLPEGS